MSRSAGVLIAVAVAAVLGSITALSLVTPARPEPAQVASAQATCPQLRAGPGKQF